MEFDEAIIGALAGAIVMVMTALLGRESVGNWLLSGERRETTAVNTMATILEKAVDGMVTTAGAVQRMGTELASHERDADMRWQSRRDVLQRVEECVNEIHADQKKLMRMLGTETQ